jgi:hypothetical protein
MPTSSASICLSIYRPEAPTSTSTIAKPRQLSGGLFPSDSSKENDVVATPSPTKYQTSAASKQSSRPKKIAAFDDRLLECTETADRCHEQHTSRPRDTEMGPRLTRQRRRETQRSRSRFARHDRDVDTSRTVSVPKRFHSPVPGGIAPP